LKSKGFLSLTFPIPTLAIIRNKMKEELKILQDEFATIDLFSSNMESGHFEILIKKFLPIKIKMYQENHNLPHIHIDYGKMTHTASYSIGDMSRIAGTLDKKYDNIVKKWIEENKDKLIKIWKEVQSGKIPNYLITEL